MDRNEAQVEWISICVPAKVYGARGLHPRSGDQTTKRFQRDKKSWTRDPKVFVDAGLPMPGEPALIKTRIHLRRDAAEQL